MGWVSCSRIIIFLGWDYELDMLFTQDFSRDTISRSNSSRQAGLTQAYLSNIQFVVY
jgi:hypothetical protein